MVQSVQVSNCPDASTLSSYVSGDLDETAVGGLLEHVNRCQRCQQIIDELAGRADSLIDALRRQIENQDTLDQPGLDRLMARAKGFDPDAPVGDDGHEADGRAEDAKKADREEFIDLELFINCLRKSGLIEPAEVDALSDTIVASDSETLARELISRKRITSFQAKALLRGKYKGFILGKYVVLEKLGQGGMGHVYKARHQRMGRIVCLKVLGSQGRKSPEVVQRFRREAKTVAALNHPNIVVAHDADEADGIPFLVMEFIEGSDLAQLVEKQGAFNAAKATAVVRQAAQALDYAHQQRVVHRDIKPHNLLLADSEDNDVGVVKILDMGLARFDSYLGHNPDASTHASMTGSGVIMGTVDYMSPEQALNSRHADNRSDIYSLGCTLYFLLAGKGMFEGETLMEKLIAHREVAPPSLQDVCADASEGLDAIFQRMVAKDPEQRYASMADLADDLQRLEAGEPPLALVERPEPEAEADIEPENAIEPEIEPIAIDMQPKTPPTLPPRPGHDKKPSPVSRKTALWAGAAAAVLLLLACGAWMAGTFGEPAAPVDTELAAEELPPEPILPFPDIHKDTLAKGGPGRALVVIPEKGFHKAEYEQTVAALGKRGVQVVTASTKAGESTTKENTKIPIDLTLDKVDMADFDAVMFCVGTHGDFTPKGSAEAATIKLVEDVMITDRLRVAVALGGAAKILDNVMNKLNNAQKLHNCRCEYRDAGNVALGGVPGLIGKLVKVPESKYLPSATQLIFDKILYQGHPDTLARGGAGRALVVVSHKDFDGDQYEAVVAAFRDQGVAVVTASSKAGSAEPRKGSGGQKITAEVALEDVHFRDFDAIVFCDGNLNEFNHKASQYFPNVVKPMILDLLAEPRALACFGGGDAILREFEETTRLQFAKQREVQFGIPKERAAHVFKAPSAKQAAAMVALILEKLHESDTVVSAR